MADKLNADIGRNVELLFENSIDDFPDAIEAIRKHFKISGSFLKAISTGRHSEKVDVKMEFSDGRNIDANIKAFSRSSASYNQMTRSSISSFCELFFDAEMKELIEGLFIQKAKNKNNHTFPEETASYIIPRFQAKAREILIWSLSRKSSREILVIFERDTRVMYIYPMKEVIKKINLNVSLTKNGCIALGDSIVIQRKGGNGVHSKDIPKDSLSHPGNNVQIKMKMKKFITEMSEVCISSYQI